MRKCSLKKSHICIPLDIIIGAPYGGEDGTGAVYVYEGSRNGIQRAFSQVCLQLVVVLHASRMPFISSLL